MEERKDGHRLTNRYSLHKKLDAAGWGLFFIWTGIALSARVGWGAGLLGVGIIGLGGQAARYYLGLKLERFWVAVGLLFVLGGVWELFKIRFDLTPILCMIGGAALFLSGLFGKGRNQMQGQDRTCLK